MEDYEKNELKTHLKEYCDFVLEPSKGRNFYVCPYCGSGTGKHRTGAFHLFPDREPTGYRCFAPDCGVSGDLFSLMMKIENLTFLEALNRASERYGNGRNQFSKLVPMIKTTPSRETEPLHLTTTPPCQEWQRALIPVVERAEQTIFEYQGKDALQFLRKRGIDEQTIRENHIGYIPPISTEEWCIKTGYAYSMNTPIPDDDRKKLGIPIGITFPYFMDGQLYKLETRRLPNQITDEIDKMAQVRRERNIITSAIFGGDYAACTDKKYRDVIFVEGVIDALTINQTVGRNCNNEIYAVTFGSANITGDANAFYRYYIMPRRVVVAFDNDDAGRKGGAELAAAITKARRDAKHPEPDAEIAFSPKKYNDWNEYFTKEPDTFFQYVSDLLPI